MPNLKKNIIAEKQHLMEPVDIALLEKEGILSKSGAWHVIQDPNRIPDLLLRLASDIKILKNGTIKVKLPKQSRIDRLIKDLGDLESEHG